MESIKELFEAKRRLLESSLGIGFNHPTTKGDHCECDWIKFLRSFLPNRYAVTKGFVFDSLGRVSDQIDIIVYDAFYSPLVFETASGEKYVTAESVYAVFESKPKIDKHNLSYTKKKIETVTSLHRTSRSIINAGKEVPARELTAIIGGILATHSVSAKTLREHLVDFPNINIGVSAGGIMFINTPTEPKIIDDPENTLTAFFCALLNELHKQGTIQCIDIREYAKNSSIWEVVNG